MKVFQAIFFMAGFVLLPALSVRAEEVTHAGQAINDAGQASAHASGSAAHSIAASGQVTSAMLAVPLMSGAVVAGSVAGVSAGAAQDSMRAASAPIGAPLEITSETVTVVPPDVALKTRAVKP